MSGISAWTETETHILLDRDHLRLLSDNLWVLENDMKDSILHELAHIIVQERLPKSWHNYRWQVIFALLCTHFGVEMTSIRRVEPA